MNKYLILGICILGGLLYWSNNSRINEKCRADRMTINFQEEENDNKSLQLSINELQESTSDRIKQLSDSLNIKSKNIKEYVYIELRDTVIDTVYIDLIKANDTTFTFTKEIECHNISGELTIKDSVPELKFNEISYSNNLEYVAYLDKKEFKLWFIKFKYGHKDNIDLAIFPECGDVTIERVQIIK